jgi:hypothetical protein
MLSINCVQFNILFELDIFVVSRLFDMSKTLYYKTLRINVRENQGDINNEHTRETGNIGYTRRRQTNQKHNTTCFGHHYEQAHRNNVNGSFSKIANILVRLAYRKKYRIIVI